MADSSSRLAGPNRFKLGVFCFNVESANALTAVPERWRADWDAIAAFIRMADRAGIEFALPIARWRGYGEANHRGAAFETMTLAASLAPITERITLFCTVHVPLIHPLLAAKSMTTIDHASHGRAGLNITAGWNQDKFDMFGHAQEPHDDRYVQAREWHAIFARALAAERPFDHAGLRVAAMVTA
jgi:alkanesulfonate monooxygenase SsuD/methylene tetrahydromethanopterin reductase-like flavin-dependent oxidoreductase (luciferase family)